PSSLLRSSAKLFANRLITSATSVSAARWRGVVRRRTDILYNSVAGFRYLNKVLSAGRAVASRRNGTRQERSGRSSSCHCLHHPLSLSGPDSISRVGTVIPPPVTRDNRRTASCSCSLRFGIYWGSVFRWDRLRIGWWQYLF